MHGFGGYGLGMGVGSIFMILFWAVIIYLLFTLLRGNTRQSSDSAIEILRERYAKGEISKEQFEQMKKELQS